MYKNPRIFFAGIALTLLVMGASVALSAHTNRNQSGPFRARFINETGTDIILVLESPEPGVGLTLHLDEGKKSNVVNIRGGSRPLMAWDDTTLELLTLMPLVVDKNMRIYVRRMVPASTYGAGQSPSQPTDDP